MINLLALDVAQSLVKQKYPATVVYGPQYAEPTNYPYGLIHIERDPRASDSLGPVQGTPRNPAYKGTRRVAARATIYMQAPDDGARIEEHEDYCEAYVDAFLVAVFEWCSKSERGSDPFQLGAMRYLTDAERNSEKVWPGVAYRIQFSISRAVVKQTFEGEIKLTGRPVGVANRTDVSYRADDPTKPPDVNCDGGTDLGDTP